MNFEDVFIVIGVLIGGALLGVVGLAILFKYGFRTPKL